MAEKEDRWRVAPFVPNPHSRPEERIASALEYIATQIGQINQKMGLFPTRNRHSSAISAAGEEGAISGERPEEEIET